MHLRKPLAAIFSPTRRLDDPEQGVVLAGGRFGEVEWVVPRGECDYRRMDFSRLPPRQRSQAARIAANRHAGGPGGFHVAWTGPVAHVWTLGSGTSDYRRRWIPESLLRAPPGGDGPRLLRMVRGVEAQCWRDGQLQASQWWPAPPSLQAWHRFVRSCGMTPRDGAVPAALDVGWTPPWGDRSERLPLSPDVLERWAWHAVAGVVALALGWQLAADLQWRRALASVETRIETLRAKAAPLLDARERAERAQLAAEALARLQATRSDYDLVAGVVGPLPADARLLGWQREREQLQATIASSVADPREFVTAYAGDPELRDVVATPGADRTVQLAFELPAGGAPQ